MPHRRTAHRWTFTRRIRPNAFGWKASALATSRLKEALAEIRAVARREPVVAAEGAVRLLERLWPALEHIDTSSGTLGSAVARAVDEVVEIVCAARPDEKTRADWLGRLFEAIQDDGVDYLARVGECWGELCGSPEVASEWADNLVTTLRSCWSDPAPGAWFSGASACLSALLAAGRHDELFELLALKERPFWAFHRFGVLALAAQGRVDEAIEFSEKMALSGDGQWPGDELCEALLLQAGRAEEAWQRFGVRATHRATYLATFRAIAKKYPGLDSGRILQDLIAASPGREGKWFAVAVRLGDLELAADVLRRSPTSHKTALRAAHEHAGAAPEFSLNVAMTTLRWLFDGLCHDVTVADVIGAIDLAIDCTAQLGGEPERAVTRISDLATRPGCDAWLTGAAVRHLDSHPAMPDREQVRGGGSRAVPPGERDPGLPPGTSVSRTFLDFLEPVADGLGDDTEAWSAALGVGTAVWNSVVLEASGQAREYLADVRSRVRGTPQAVLVEMLVSRKRKRFGEHMWLVGQCGSFEDADGGLRIRVEARSVFGSNERGRG